MATDTREAPVLLRPPPVVSISSGLVRIPLTILWGVTIAAIAWAIVNPQAQFLAFGIAACGIVTLPMLSSSYDLLSPWSMVALMVYIGCGVRSFFVTLEIDGKRSIDELFLRGQEPSFFVYPSLLYLVALALMAFAYNVKTERRRRTRMPGWLAEYRFGRQFDLVVAVCAAIGFFAFVQYARSSGGLSLDRISAKRETISGLALQTDYQAHGALLTLSSFGAVAFWMLLAKYAHAGVRHSLISGRGLVLLALFLNASALPVYASQRTGVVYLLIVAVVIKLSLQRGKGTGRLLLRSGVAILVGFAILATLRAAAQADAPTNFSQDFTLTTVGDALVYNRNFSDIPTSAQIINAVPEVLPLKYGETIYSWLVAPVPRSVWPEKPLVSAGPEIGIKVFGSERTGVPPGLIAEMYWNFGMVGTIIGAWLFGRLLRRAYETMAPSLHNPAVVVLYSAVVIRFGGQAFTSSLGQSLFNAILDTGIILTVIALTTAGRGNREKQWPPISPDAPQVRAAHPRT